MMIKLLAPSTRTACQASGNWLLATLCLGTCLFSGCAWQRSAAKTFPWSVSAQQQPKVPAMGTSGADDSEELAGIQPELPAPPSTLTAAYSIPTRPRVPVIAAPPTPATSKPEAPVITPQLTTQEAEAAQQQTNLSLSNAEHNMLTVQGRSLNAGQFDLANKIRSFIAEARDAAHNNDWTRARDAAKKAEVLSQQLAASIR